MFEVAPASQGQGPALAERKTVPSAAALRVARLADTPAIAALYREAGGQEVTAPPVADWLEHGGALVMESAEGVIVSALRWREERGGWRLDRLATLEGYRGQGFGRWLMTRVEALAIKENVPLLSLELGSAHDEGLAYYRRMGYRQESTPGSACLRLSKRLGGTWQVKRD